MSTKSKKPIILIPLGLILISIFVIIIRSMIPDHQVLTGMVEATEIDIACKIPGRVDSICVARGGKVNKGQLLFTLQSREVDAKVEQARGLYEAAQAKLDMARSGARPEEREAAQKLFLQSEHQFDLASKTWNRIQSLYRDSVVSTQERDQVEFQWKAAMEQRDAAKARYEMVVKGARAEEIRGAEALFHQAENGLKEAESYQMETHIYSPIDGEISKLITDAGEMVAAGYPVITITKSPDQWVVLQVREDLLQHFILGSSVYAKFPGVKQENVPLKVAFIAPMADFATWRATNQKGDFDLKTFEVHLRPDQVIAGLRPGMTAQVTLQ